MSDRSEATTAEIAERAPEPTRDPPAPAPDLAAAPQSLVEHHGQPAAQTSEAPRPRVDEARHTANESSDELLPTLGPSPDDPEPIALITGPKSVVCPKCKRRWQGNDLRPHATWFCDGCQFPLFWVDAVPRSDEAAEDPDDPRLDALKRLPGTTGRDLPEFVTCWVPRCEASNPTTRTTCVRCGAALTPPPPPTAPPPTQIVYLPSEVVYVRQRIWPWIVATGVVGVALLTVLLVLLLGD